MIDQKAGEDFVKPGEILFQFKICKNLYNSSNVLNWKTKIFSNFADENFSSVGVAEEGCFLSAQGAKVYFYAPIFCLLCFNTIMYVLTIYSLWKSHRENQTAVLSRVNKVRKD